MSSRPDRNYNHYRHFEGRLHVVLAVTVTAALGLLLTTRHSGTQATIGAALDGLAVTLLFGVILGSDIWCPRVPNDVWDEANEDHVFREHAESMNALLKLHSAKGSRGQTREGMSIPVEEAVALYRQRYAVHVVRRGGRRLLILAAIVATYAAAARFIVLASSLPYGHHLTVSNNIFDYLYFSFIAVSTIGYGDITPTADAARIVSIAFGAITVIYLLMILNYVWIHEARREGLLTEYLRARYLGLPAGEAPA
jgi:hypothetical protein